MKIILDTDIGSDVDDSLALGVLLGSPEVDLLGVTTVYGDTHLRARICARLIELARPDSTIPVIPGAEKPLSGLPVWWAGHEGVTLDGLNDQSIDTSQDAATFLTDMVRTRPGQVNVFANAPLTNIAEALSLDPTFANNVGHVYIMGGHFGPNAKPEHNLRSDAVAAARVFTAGMPLTVIGIEMTTRLRLNATAADQIARSGAFGTALRLEIDQWSASNNGERAIPHDPLNVLTALTPGLFAFRSTLVTIEEFGDDQGASRSSVDDHRRLSRFPLNFGGGPGDRQAAITGSS